MPTTVSWPTRVEGGKLRQRKDPPSRSIKALPTQKRLRELLEYDPTTGTLRWRVARGRGVRPGAIAGRVGLKGRVVVRVDGVDYFAARLIYKLIQGQDPVGTIVFCDSNCGNYRWDNLRDLGEVASRSPVLAR